MTLRLFITVFLLSFFSFCSENKLDKYDFEYHPEGFGHLAFCLRDENNSEIKTDKAEVTINDSISILLATDEVGENRHSLRLKAGKYKMTFGVRGYKQLVTRTVEIQDAKTNFMDCITLVSENKDAH